MTAQEKRREGLSLADSVALISLLLAILVFVLVPSVLVKSVLLLVALLIVAAIIWRSKWTLDLAIRNKAVALLVIGAALIAIALPQLRDQLRKEKEASAASEQAGEEPAHLSVKLVIENVTPRKLDFHLQVENIGNVQVQRVRHSFQSAGMIASELSPHVNNTIPPKGELLIPGIVNDLSKSRVLLVDLVYETNNSGGRSFTSQYKFILPSGTIKPQTLAPVEWQETTGDVATQEAINEIISGLKQVTGTVFLVVPERTVDGRPNQVLVGNDARQIAINSRTRRVAFRSTFPTGRIEVLEKSFSNAGNTYHIVMAQWDDTVIGLAVDGSPISKISALGTR